ncbi:MAG: O-antigen ligase domain-containing protein [Betaproteobacteria bacterium]|nr:O-antigen ligase domain-containing protein [Betaproteobacteria bacterium]
MPARPHPLPAGYFAVAGGRRARGGTCMSAVPMHVAPSGLQARAAQAARWAVVASAFAVPLPAAWIGLTTSAFVLLWLLGGNLAERWAVIRRTPIAWIALLVWAWMGLAVLWSPAALPDALANWWQYRELLLLPLMTSVVLGDPHTAQRWQARILDAFLAGFVIALAVSKLRWLGVLPDMGFKGEYAGFGGRTGFSLMLAFVSFVAIERLRERPLQRVRWSTLALACLLNLFFINTGRTGQLGFLLLLPLLAWRWGGRRALWAGVIAAPLLGGLLLATVPAIQERAQASLEQIDAFRAGGPQSGDGLRLQYWQEAMHFIHEAPAFGGGTGSHAYRAREAAAREAQPANRPLGNPHNEYLLIVSQQGVIGLGLLLMLWLAQWRNAHAADGFARGMTCALLLLMASGDLFNSFLLDNLEGHFYLLMTLAFAQACDDEGAS